MTCTERHMGIGAWFLRLRPDTPGHILNKLHPRESGFGHVVITPTRVNLGDMSDAAALGLSRYTGIYLSQPSEFELAGMGVNGWLGNGSDRGVTTEPPLSTPGTGTFANWVSALTPGFLTAGVTSVISGTYAKAFPRAFFREIADDVAERFGAEWKVTNQFAFDFGLAADLFNLDPTAVIVRHAADSGRDLNVIGITGDLQIERDLEDWAWRVVYFWGSSFTRATQAGGVADIDVPFRGPTGARAHVDNIVEDSATTTSGDAVAAGLTLWNQNASVRQELRLSSVEYDIGRDVAVGDNVFVFDLRRGLFDQSNPVLYRGQTIYPETVRCVGQTWPVRNGMGVWFRRWVKVAGVWEVEWFDLTPFVEWESGQTTVEVGAKPRPVSKK